MKLTHEKIRGDIKGIGLNFVYTVEIKNEGDIVTKGYIDYSVETSLWGLLLVIPIPPILKGRYYENEKSINPKYIWYHYNIGLWIGTRNKDFKVIFQKTPKLF